MKRLFTFFAALLITVGTAVADSYWDEYATANPIPLTVTDNSGGGVSISWVEFDGVMEIWKNGALLDRYLRPPVIDPAGTSADVYVPILHSLRNHVHVSDPFPGSSSPSGGGGTNSTCLANLGDVHTMPGIIGYGTAQNAAGRGGDTCVVRNLNDDGGGSLRECVTSSSTLPNGDLAPRMVIFDVGGRIDLDDELVLARGRLSILGQSAAGEGIELYRSTTTSHRKIISVPSGSDYTLIQHMSLIGDPIYDPISYSGSGGDGLSEYHTFAYNTIVGATDETFQAWDSNQNLTVAYNLFAEPLSSDPAAFSGWKGPFFDSSNASDSGNISFAYNVMSDGIGRMPFYKGVSGDIDHYGNIVHQSGNWALQIETRGRGTRASVQNNIYQSVVGGIGGDIFFDGSDGEYYVDGNVTERIVGSHTSLSSPVTGPRMPLLASNQLFAQILPTAGHSLPARGVSDQRRINEVINDSGTQLMTATDQVERPTVLDNPLVDNNEADGVPAAWKVNCGYTAGTDMNSQPFSNGYSGLENWIYLGQPGS